MSNRNKKLSKYQIKQLSGAPSQSDKQYVIKHNSENRWISYIDKSGKKTQKNIVTSLIQATQNTYSATTNYYNNCLYKLEKKNYMIVEAVSKVDHTIVNTNEIIKHSTPNKVHYNLSNSESINYIDWLPQSVLETINDFVEGLEEEQNNIITKISILDKQDNALRHKFEDKNSNILVIGNQYRKVREKRRILKTRLVKISTILNSNLKSLTDSSLHDTFENLYNLTYDFSVLDVEVEI